MDYFKDHSHAILYKIKLHIFNLKIVIMDLTIVAFKIFKYTQLKVVLGFLY